jgi:7,8-dihydropterin-6-yl-methyl-4-(beta-D-ribofuranosyl)aminobenzene 5'-phosphate synthase
MNDRVQLQSVDAVDVTILVDNSIDLLMPSTETARRPPLLWDWSERDQLIAEHGYSLLVTVHKDGKSDTILYDAGLGRTTAVHNMDILGVNAKELRAVVLSHGHADHHGGLEGLFQRVGRQRMPLVLHPDAKRA